MDIAVKAVKCGDSSLINGTTQHLLIDCGSDNVGGGLSSSNFAYQSIFNDISTNQINELMITHFHKDHFNGILNIPDSYHLDKVYLPYSIIDGHIAYSGPIARLLAIAPPLSFGFKLSQKIIDLFAKLDKIANSISCLKAGDFIPFDGTRIRILWPETTYPYGSLPIKSFYAGKPSGSLANSVADFIPETRELQTIQSIEDFLKSVFNDIVQQRDPEFFNIYITFQGQFEEYLTAIHNRDSNNNPDFSQVLKTYSDLIEAKKRFLARLDLDTLHAISYFSRNQYHHLIKSMNAISLICDCDEHFLYLGDAPSPIISHLKGSFKKYYNCVKLQHHATDGYYCADTPNGQNWIVSNGGYQRRKVSCDFVSGTSKIKIICTNAHEAPERFCNYYVLHHHCNPNCVPVFFEHNLSV